MFMKKKNFFKNLKFWKNFDCFDTMTSKIDVFDEKTFPATTRTDRPAAKFLDFQKSFFFCINLMALRCPHLFHNGQLLKILWDRVQISQRSEFGSVNVHRSQVEIRSLAGGKSDRENSLCTDCVPIEIHCVPAPKHIGTRWKHQFDCVLGILFDLRVRVRPRKSLFRPMHFSHLGNKVCRENGER